MYTYRNAQKLRQRLSLISQCKLPADKLQPWSQGLEKKSFYTHFAPPHLCAMLTRHFHLTQVCILPFSNIERGNGGVETYSVSITIMISCFWHFPTQFVQGYYKTVLRANSSLLHSGQTLVK